MSSRGDSSTSAAQDSTNGGGVRRVVDDRRVHDVADLRGLDLDRREDAEVGARAAHGPQQVGLVLGVRAHDPAVGEDDLGGDHVVEREPVRAREEPLAAGGDQSADADVAVVAGADREPVRRERGGDVAPARTGAEPHEPALRGPAPRSLSSAPTSMTMPPSFVDRPLIPCPPLRTANGTSCARANAQRVADVLRRGRADDEAGGARVDVRRPHACRTRGRRARRPSPTRDAGQRVVVDARHAAWPAPPPDGPRRSRCRRRDRSAATASRSAGATSCAEDGDRPLVVAGQDEGRDPVLEHQGEQLVDPLLGRPCRNPCRRTTAAEVEQPTDLARVAAGRLRRLVDASRCRRRGRRAAGSPGSAATRRPCAPTRPSIRGLYAPSQIGMSCAGAGPRLAPSTGGTCRATRSGARSSASQMPRMMSIASSSAVTPSPGRQPRRAHRDDRVPERPGAQPEREPAAGEQVEARGRAGEHGGRAQREVEHVAGQLHALGRGGHPGQQRPRVEERRLVRVVLERHQVEPGALARLGERDDLLRVLRRRRQEAAEDEVVAVVGHAQSPH